MTIEAEKNKLKIVFFLLFALILLAFSPYLFVKDDQNFIIKHEHLFDNTGTLKISDVQNMAFSNDSIAPNYSYGVIWHRITLSSQNINTPLSLRFSPAHRNEVTLYSRKLDSRREWIIQKTGNSVSWNERDGDMRLSSFNLQNEIENVLYLSVNSYGNMNITPHVLKRSDNIKREKIISLWQSFYLVAMCIILTGGIISFMVFRKKNNLNFIISNFLYIVLALCIFDTFSPLFVNMNMQGLIISKLIPIITLFLALYHRGVMVEYLTPYSLIKIINILIIVIIFCVLLSMLGFNVVSHKINNLVILSLCPVLMISVLLIDSEKSPNKHAIVFYYSIFLIITLIHISLIMLPPIFMYEQIDAPFTLIHGLSSSIIFGHLIYNEFKNSLKNNRSTEIKLALSNQAIEQNQFKLSEQKRFTNMLAHEIKNPLATIRFTSELLLTSYPTEKNKIYRIDRSINAIDLLVSKFVLTDKIEQGGDIVIHEKFNLSKIISDIATKYNISNVSSEQDFYVCGDVFLIDVAIQNLFENASKYAKDIGSINLHIKNSSEFVTLTIQNNVREPKNIEIKDIFNKYYRGSSSNAVHGTGIGLYLVHWIISRHNGEIHANILDDVFSISVKLPL